MSEQEQDVVAILQKMQQQLTYLEKKLDTLIQQSQQKPMDRPGNFGRPFRPFRRHDGPPGRPEGGFNRDRGNSHGYRPDRQDSGHGGQGGHGNFAPKKKPFFGRRRER